MYPGESKSVWKSLDWWVVILYLVLCVIGCLSIYGASYDFERPGFFDFSQRAGKQFIWCMLAIGIAVTILLFDSNTYFNWAFIFYAFIMALMVLTIFVAQNIKGSRSWLVLGPVNVQPAEFAKVATALAVSRFMGSYNFNLKRLNHAFVVAMLILLPFVLTLLQNETGSALVFLSLMLMLYREGMPGILLFLIVCLGTFFVLSLRFADTIILGNTSAGLFSVMMLILLVVWGMLVVYGKDWKSVKLLVAISLLTLAVGFLLHLTHWVYFDLNWLMLGLIGLTVVYLLVQALLRRTSLYTLVALFAVGSVLMLYSSDYAFDNLLEPHHQLRIKVLLGMENDPTGAGYNVNQSKIAIGSGGFLGKGFLNGTQTKLKYVPEQDTDFIFCTVGEEHGFVGSVLVLAIYLVLLIRLIYLAERQYSPFSRIYGYCVVCLLFFHFMVNIGMVLGLLPVIGIPLPFISYGGSSLWAFTVLLFIFLRLDADRSQYY